MKVCECGCGGEIQRRKWWRRWKDYAGPRFIQGHNVGVAARLGKPHRVYVPLPEEIPSGVCECGCGRQTGIAKHTLRSRRYFRGYPVPRLSGHTKGITKTGAASHKWRSGRCLHRGYIMISAPDHPDVNARGYIMEHRLVAEKMLGRRLERQEKVHHRNHDKADNRPENLQVMTQAEHLSQHMREHWRAYWALAEKLAALKT